jgi:hypothetical protein
VVYLGAGMPANQIYHTSHCGSTLLAAMIAPCFDVYTEPSWSHRIVQKITDDYSAKINAYKESDVVKLPSGLCHYAVETDGLKVFIYRKLRHHLMEMFLNDLHYQVDYYFEFMFSDYKHPELQHLSPISLAEKHCFLWLNRVLWMQDAKDVLWVEANDYFSSAVERSRDVVDYFGGEHPENVQLIVRDVKELGCNHNDTPLRKDLPFVRHGAFRHPATAIIYDEIVAQDDGVNELASWAVRYTPSIDHRLV